MVHFKMTLTMRPLLMAFLLVIVPGIHSAPFNPDDPKQETMPGPIEAGSVRKSDILFVLDASSSISIEKFDAMRSFVKEIVNTELKARLGRDHTQVALVLFSTDVVENIPFNKYSDAKDFNEAITKLKYTRGESNLGKTLRYVHRIALRPENGWRPTVPLVIIILTDGWASDRDLARKQLGKLKKSGAHPLLVGIGQYVDKAGLNTLVSSKEIVRVEEWTGLKAKVPELRDKMHSQAQRIDRCDRHFKANVIFVVDSSTSVGIQNFMKMKSLLINITRGFKVIGKDGVEVGLVQYSSYKRTRAIFQLDTYTDHKGLETAIKNLKWTKGGSRTGYAMRMADVWLVKEAKHLRKGVHNNFIVVTDGKARDRVENGARALHIQNYTVLAIGIGKDICVKELRRIASNPKELHVFHPKNFNELPNFLRYVVTEVCHNNDVVSDQRKAEEAEAVPDDGKGLSE